MQPISVACPTPWPDGLAGQAFLQARRVELSPRVCATLNGEYGDDPGMWGPAALTLAHEFIHVSLQTRDERVAECWGVYLTRYFLVRVFRKTPAFAQRAYDAAWAEHEVAAIRNPEYGPCAYEKVDTFTPLNP